MHFLSKEHFSDFPGKQLILNCEFKEINLEKLELFYEAISLKLDMAGFITEMLETLPEKLEQMTELLFLSLASKV